MGVIDHIANLFDQGGIKYSREGDSLMTLWKTDHFAADLDGDGEDDTSPLKIRIVTNNDESWVFVVAPFTNFFDVPEEHRGKFAYDMLKASFDVNGVKLCLDNDDDIIVIAESNDTELSVDEIVELTRNVVRVCDKLWEIYPS